MAVVISMLRGVNVGGHNRMKMDALRSVYSSIGLHNPQTYVQSGNVIFESGDEAPTELANRLEDAIEAHFKFRPAVILRTADELREVIVRNPFPERAVHEASKLLITFLSSDPGEAARAKVRAISVAPEQLVNRVREIYTYFPVGMGRSRIPAVLINKALQTQGTARNWNSVIQMLQIAENR